MLQWLLDSTSDNFRYLTLVQKDWWWYCYDWNCERFSFAHNVILTGDLWISNAAFYKCATVTSGFHLWQFQVFNSGAEDCLGYCFDWNIWVIFFLSTMGLNWVPLNLKSFTLPLCHSDFRFLPMTILLSITVFGISETTHNCHIMHLNKVLNRGQYIFGNPPYLNPIMDRQSPTNQIWSMQIPTL